MRMPSRASVNLSLPVELVERAKKLGINLSRAAERGLIDAVDRAEKPGFYFGALKGDVSPPPLDVFAPMTDEEAQAERKPRTSRASGGTSVTARGA